MDNIWKAKGALNSQKPDSGGAVLRQLPMLGVVKDNVDPIRAGRIRVYISALGANNPDDEKNWTPILYMSPFFGMTNTTGGNDDFGSFKANPASYGIWQSPPDIGTTVVCLFINGDPNYGFYLGSIPDPESLRMVPAIGANFDDEDIIFSESEADKYGGATRLPVVNMNTNNNNKANSDNFVTSPKPVHSFQASIMFQQGILRDPIRGPISSSSQRESPSRVGWGVSTPGRPIYEGGYTDESIINAAFDPTKKDSLKVVSRRGGHTIVMDDGNLIGQDNLIRIRTSLGHQILMSDDGQTLMILHSNGQSYIELGKEGTIDMYSTNSVNIRTQGDLNLHADNNININAAKKLNVFADEINVQSENATNQTVGTNYKVFTQGNHTHKVEGAMSMASTGEASFASSNTTFINGSIINLNTGSASTTPEKVDPIPIIAQTDSLFSSEKGWTAAPGKLLTIVSRAPAHAPWVNAGQGVDVKVNLDADAQLPQAPNPQVSSANDLASTTPEYPTVTVPGAATVPPVPAASEALDKNSTSSIVSAAAATAASAAPAAVKAGVGTISNAVGAIQGVAVGIPGLSAKALENAGSLKPGSGALVDSLAQAGKKMTEAMPANLFTGVNGVSNLPNLVNNVTAQATAAVANLTNAQSLLTKTGLISGKEAPSAIAGSVMSTALNGIPSTVDAIKNIGTQLNPLNNNLKGEAEGALKSIASGSFASNLAQNVTGGLSGLANSIKEMPKGLASVADNAKGIAAGAFASVKNSLKSFKPGIPQNLKAIAEKNAAEAIQSINFTDPYAGLSSEQIKKLGGADPTDPAIRSKLGLPNLSTTLSASSVASSLASGVSNLPGGAGAIASLVNKAGSNIIPGGPAIKSLMDNVSAAANNGLSLQSALSTVTNLPTSVSGAVSGLNAITSATSSLSSVSSAIGSLQSGLGTSVTRALGGTSATGIGAIGAGVSALTGVVNASSGVGSIASQLGSATSALSGLGSASNLLSGITNLKAGANINAVAGVAGLADTLGKSLEGLGGSNLSGTLDKLKSGAANLSSLASTGLSPAAASQLNSAISSLSSGGPVLIKIPTVATDTTDRSSISGAVSALLPAGVPAPNFGSVTKTTLDNSSKLSDMVKKDQELKKKSDEKFKIAMASKEAFNKASQNLGPDNPETLAEKEKWIADTKNFQTASNERLAHLDEIKKLKF